MSLPIQNTVVKLLNNASEIAQKNPFKQTQVDALFDTRIFVPTGDFVKYRVFNNNDINDQSYDIASGANVLNTVLSQKGMKSVELVTAGLRVWVNKISQHYGTASTSELYEGLNTQVMQALDLFKNAYFNVALYGTTQSAKNLTADIYTPRGSQAVGLFNNPDVPVYETVTTITKNISELTDEEVTKFFNDIWDTAFKNLSQEAMPDTIVMPSTLLSALKTKYKPATTTITPLEFLKSNLFDGVEFVGIPDSYFVAPEAGKSFIMVYKRDSSVLQFTRTDIAAITSDDAMSDGTILTFKSSGVEIYQPSQVAKIIFPTASSKVPSIKPKV